MHNTLQAKITPPRPPQTLLEESARAGLYQQARERSLVLICAPAGYGKTTLASVYCRSAPGFSCWYSLDEADNDGQIFARYLVASLAQQIELPEALQEKAARGQFLSLGDLLREVLFELEKCPDPLRLVLDDFHVLHHPVVLSAITLFLSYLPPRVQIVISSRTEPESLQRLFVRHGVLRLSARDLQLGEDAVVQLFSTHGHTISPAAARRLNDRAQGWVTGLKLIALGQRESASLESTTGTLQGPEIRNYLFQEVYLQLNPGLRRFLTRTSICERFNRELAKTLTGQQQIEHLLQDIDQQQFFLSRFGEDGTWFRYHPLLAEFLRGQLDNEEEARELHVRAGQWWQEQGQLHIAAQHYAASADIAAVSAFLLSQGDTLFNLGHTQVLADCFASLPPAIISADLHLTSMSAWLEHVVRRRPEKVLLLIAAAEKHLLRTLSQDEARRRLAGQLGSVHASICLDSGEVEQASALVELALKQWEHDPRDFTCAAIHASISDIAVHNGDLRTALDHSLLAAEIDRQHGLFLGVFWHLHQQAGIAWCKGDLAGADRMLDAAMALVETERLGHLPRYDAWLRSKARLLTLRLQFQEAERCLNLAVAHNEAWPHEQILNQIYLCRIALARHDLGAVATLAPILEATWFSCVHPHTRAELSSVLVQLWVSRRDHAALQRFVTDAAPPAQALGPDRQLLNRSLVHAHLALGQAGIALDVLAPPLHLAREHGQVADYHYDAVLQVAGLWQLGQQTAAAELLGPTLDWVAQQEAYLLVLSLGPMLEGVLECLAPGQRTAARLLQLMRQRELEAQRGTTHTLPDAVRIHGLTRQEWLLLQLIAQELSNDAICDTLHVSMNTVRSHIRRINKKLGVSNRGEAVQACLRLRATESAS